MKKIMACILVMAILVPLWGCADSAEQNLDAVDLMEGIKANPVSTASNWNQEAEMMTDFGVRLLQSSMEAGENTLVSPLSVVSALAMTANGADGETLTQMESVLGMSIDTLNPFLHSYMEMLSQMENSDLAMANSIWFKDDPKLSVEPAFLQANADYYDAGIYRAPFDRTTADDINHWVSDHTDGMIPDILEEIPTDAVMYLVNALAFDAEWQNIYYKDQVHTETFTTEAGQAQEVQLMYSGEGYYLKDEQSVGFMKYYKGKRCAFVALLPNEGVSVASYVNNLTGQHLHQMLSTPEETLVETAIPKFEASCDLELSEVLMEMGMTDAFDWTNADFSRLGTCQDGNIFISRVLHKTYIGVNELGTRAGAVTAVEIAEGAAMDPKTVLLDRPFVYMLIDCETMIPFFIGTLMQVN